MQNTSPPGESDLYQEDEGISLHDIILFLIEGKKWILSTIAVFMLTGIAYALFAPPKYEATATIEMASVSGKIIEEPNILAEKLKLPLYYSAATYKACNVENEMPSPGEHLTHQLKPTVSKNAPIVRLKFNGDSAGEAKRCLEAVLADIRSNQNASLKPIFDTKKSQLQLLKQKLDAAEKLSAQLSLEKLKLEFSDPKFPAAAMLLATLTQKDNEIKDLTEKVNDLELSLKPPQSRETSLVTPVYAPEIKASPNMILVLALSAIAGLFAGILLFLGKKLLSSGYKAS